MMLSHSIFDVESTSTQQSSEEKIFAHLNEKKEKYNQKLIKAKRNSGEEYITSNQKIIFSKRVIVEPCCVKKCGDKVSLSSRQMIFDNFWKLADFKKQNLFLSAMVKRETPKQRRPRSSESKLRESSFRYYLTHEDTIVLVCKKFFCDTFNISKGRLDRVLKREDPAEDLRGKSENSRRTTEESLIVAVKEHINSFPTFMNTKCVKHTLFNKKSKSPKQYLSPDLNIRKMYNLYREKCENNNESHVNEWIYRRVFKSDFNLYFNQPKDEICQKCELLKIQIVDGNPVENQMKQINNVHHNSNTSDPLYISENFPIKQENLSIDF